MKGVEKMEEKSWLFLQNSSVCRKEERKGNGRQDSESVRRPVFQSYENELSKILFSQNLRTFQTTDVMFCFAFCKACPARSTRCYEQESEARTVLSLQ